LAATGINRTINFQGKLVNNPLGTNVTNSSYSIVFTLYNNPNVGQGTALWTETQNVTTVDGIFRVALGSVTAFPANFNFNWDGLYLGIKVGADTEMTPRVQMAAVPFAFNAQQVAGLTVQDAAGLASTSGTLQVANAKTVKFADAFTTANAMTFGSGTTGTVTLGTGTNTLQFSTTNNTAVTLPTSGTLLTNTTTAIQTVTSTQTTGTVLGIADSTGLTGAITGFNLALTSTTNSQNKTGIAFDLSGGSSGTYYDLYGTGGTWNITRAGVLTVTSCVGCGTGGGGPSFWQELIGAISPLQVGDDLLIGGSTTASAEFSFTGLMGSQTQASMSGNLILMPNTGYGGKVGIGTTAPASNLTVNSTFPTGTVASITNSTTQTGAVIGQTITLSGATGSLAQTGLQFNLSGATSGTALDIQGTSNSWNVTRAGAGTFASVTSTGAIAANGGITFDQSTDTLGAYTLGGDVAGNSKNITALAGLTVNGGGLISSATSGTLGIGTTTNTTGLTFGNSSATSGITLNIGTSANFTLQKNGAGLDCSGSANGGKLTTNSSGQISCGDDTSGGGGGGTNYFGQTAGLTFIGNTTTDFAIGGNSTASAKFVFGNINSGIPTATFSGELMMEAQANSSPYDQTNWQKVSGTAGTIGGGATTQIASISAMVVYNGNLYVGTYKNPGGTAGSAEVYRYDGTGTTWAKVSQSTAGTIAEDAGSTTGIASVSAMTVFNGYLYVGTSKMSQAEVYRYDGGTNWTRVNTAAGTLDGSGQTTIDGISSLAVYQGILYAGTRRQASAQLHRYNGGTSWSRVNTTAGTFVTTNATAVTAITNMVVKNGFLYLGTEKTNASQVLRYQGGQGASLFTLLSSTTGGTYTLTSGTTVTGVQAVTAMAVYNGNIVVGLSKPNGAEVLMASDGLGTAGMDFWVRLNNAAGQMTNTGTSSIDGVWSLTVYNGILYAGTNEPNNAEIYRYTGTDQKWIKVTQATNGQIASGGTQNINAVTKLLPTNGDLYAGTMEDLAAEVYKLSNVNINKSYALKFHATPSIAGGEQGAVDNYASIFYLASASANLGSNLGNTGAFIFSHGIQTRNGSYDVAEDYPTRDETLRSGDVVAIDKNEKGFVKKTTEAYDYTVLGVFSENPALRLSQQDAFIDGGYVVPVALAGRVPVKVSTESGEIKSGDYLTPSSTPGVAMKATKSGGIFGQAMEGYSSDGIGKILVYIKSMTYNGSIADNFANLDTNSPDLAVNILSDLKSQSTTPGKSSIVTDTLVAGLIIADKIKANQIEGLDIFTNRISALEANAAVLSDATGSAELATTSANLPSALTLTSLNVEGLATVSGNLSVKGNGFIQGVLNVLDNITTKNLLVSQFAYFINDVVFKGNVRFNSTPTFNSDTAGFAVIKKNSDSVQINFNQEYANMPVVTANIALEKTGDDVAQKQLEDGILNGNLAYVVTQRTTKGFIIKLNKAATEDITFSWIALSVKDAKTWGLSFSPPITPVATDSAAFQAIIDQLNNSPSPPPPE
jgi:hypothetical protein